MLQDPYQARQGPMGWTALPPDQMQAFLAWYQAIARQRGLNADPFHPAHHYDHIAAYLAGAGPQPSSDPSQNWHWPSQYKMAGHPNRFIPQAGGTLLDTTTMQQLGALRQPGGR